MSKFEDLSTVVLSDEEEEEEGAGEKDADDDDDSAAVVEEEVSDDDDDISEGVEDDAAAATPGEAEEIQAHQQRQTLGLLDATEDDDEDEGGGEAYLKKLDPAMRTRLIAECHPELLMENNQDVQSKTLIQRDEHGRISDPLHRTIPFLTKYEKARVLGERAKQLNAGAVPMIKVPDYLIDGYLIAVQEFEQKKIPFIIKRPLRNNTCEYWKVSDLEVL